MISLCELHYRQVCAAWERDIPVLTIQAQFPCDVCEAAAIWVIEDVYYRKYVELTAQRKDSVNVA